MRFGEKLKFLFVSAPFGGIEVFCKNIQKVVNDHSDIDATWIWIDFHPKGFISHLPVVGWNWTLKGGLVARSRVKELENSGKQFDAVFFNHTIPAMFLSNFRKRVPMVLSLDVTAQVLKPYIQMYRGHIMKYAGFIDSLKQTMYQSIYQDAAYILAWSNLVRQSLIQDYNVDPEQIDIVPPGIDIHQWSAHSELNFQEEKRTHSKRILFVGGEFLRKGGDILLRIASRDEFQDCEFHFVTKSFEGVRNKNIFVYNNIQPNSVEILRLYRTADIFALPTRADISPNAICEALAFQLPVITTDVGGMSEIVIDGENGFLVPSMNEELFAQKLRMLIRSPDLQRKFGQLGRKFVEEKYDIKKNAEKVIEYLIKAASGKRKVPQI